MVLEMKNIVDINDFCSGGDINFENNSTVLRVKKGKVENRLIKRKTRNTHRRSNSELKLLELFGNEKICDVYSYHVITG